MNINDPKALAAELLQLSIEMETARGRLDRLTASAVALAAFAVPAPDAGMVVVSSRTSYPKMTTLATVCVVSWEHPTFVTSGWHPSNWFELLDGDANLSPEYAWLLPTPSHLTIADGRGGGEVGVDCHPYRVWRGFCPWAGPEPRSMHIGWWDSLLGSLDAWAFNHNYLPDSGRRFHHPDESTVLDCAAAHTPMTWRAA